MPGPRSTASPAEAAPAEPRPFLMPKAPGVVVWRPAPGAEPNYAIVTAVGRQALSVMVFPRDSRVGIPKDAVRHASDPALLSSANFAESGIWDYTDESKALHDACRALRDQAGPAPK